MNRKKGAVKHKIGELNANEFTFTLLNILPKSRQLGNTNKVLISLGLSIP